MALSIKLGDKELEQNPPRNNPTPTYTTSTKETPSNKKIASDSNDRKRKWKKVGKILLFLILVIFCGTTAVLAYRVKQAGDQIGLNFKPTDILLPIKKDPEVKRDKSGKYTNILIVGIDTRQTNKGLKNTDTMIVASYNHETENTVMISLPRDFYAAAPGEDWYYKVNGVYNRAEQVKEGTGLVTLKKTIEKITGMEIQYYGMIDLHGFVEAIDALGGINVNVENSFTDYSYPNEQTGGYQTVTFTKGPQKMDGETALKYARSRKSLDNGEGSDFARARRQQKVIEAVKIKLLSKETLLNPSKLLDLLTTLENNIEISEFTTEDVQAGISLVQNKMNGDIYSFVLDPTVGNYKVLKTGVVANAYSIGPILGLGVYDDIYKLTGDFLEQPDLYKENASISIYDTGRGYAETQQVALDLQEEYPFLNIIFRGTLFYDKEGVVVYQNSSGKEFSESSKFFAEELKADAKEKPEYISTNLNGEDVTILIGKKVITTTDTENSEATN